MSLKRASSPVHFVTGLFVYIRQKEKIALELNRSERALIKDIVACLRRNN
jgi:hypothetical protein